ncbi:sphingomyelin phosphodiesterase 4-like [Clavelina lepadiformis]
MNFEQSTASSNPFTAALLKPALSEKCQLLTKLIQESNIKVLHQNFSALVQDIFGLHSSGWGIQHINPQQCSFECNILKEFLSCKGPMLRLVHKLQAESMLFRYDFPYSLLPPTFVNVPDGQQRIMQQIQNISFGATQFSNGTSNLKGQACIRVSAFEFYFYHFAYCITFATPLPPSQQQPHLYQQMNLKPDENLYFSLVDDYLMYFLPLDGSCPPNMRSPETNTQSTLRSQWMPNVSSMLRKTAAEQTNRLGVTTNEIWRSDLLVHIMVEFWLGQCHVQKQSARTQLPPTEDLLRAVRRLVKHMHYFVNVNTSSLVLSQLNDSQMDQFKQNIMCNCLQPRLFEFLSYCFDIWPLNNTFRIVLETWLSYIQPWRYINISNPDGQGEQRLSDSREVANVWYHFIASNLQFYNKLFYDSITRFLRMDLSRQANSMLLYRVAKIFSQPNLLSMIEEAEAATYGGEYQPMYCPSPGSYIALPRSVEVTRPPYLISSEELRKVVNQLLIVCQQALGTVKINTKQQAPDSASRILGFIGLSSLADVGDRNFSDSSWKKSEQQINDSMLMFVAMFDLGLPDLDRSYHWENDCGNPLGPEAPDCSIGEDGNIHLSQLGRYELMNNIKKLPVQPNCDPELQPIRSFENPTLVRLCYKVSTEINKKYGHMFQGWSSRNDFVGKLAKHCLNPYAFDDNSPHKYQQAAQKVLPPARLSLRFVAHYRIISYILLYFLFGWLFGTSIISSLFFLVVICILYCILKVFVTEYIFKP